MRMLSTILVLLLVLVGAANSDSCASFPQGNIIFNDPRYNNNIMTASYINNVEEDRLILYCYLIKVGTRKNVPHAVITTLDDKHMVSIRDLDCSSTDNLFKKSYMFTHMDGTRKYLAVGVRTSDTEGSTSTWCRYDVCLDCYMSKSKFNTDSKPNQRFFRWSQPGITIVPVIPTSKPIFEPYIPKPLIAESIRIPDNLMIAEYLSVGTPKFVLNCYRMKGKYYSFVRTTMGRRIFSLEGPNCSPGQQFVNMFYVITYLAHKKFNIYELGGKATDKDWPWYNGGGDQASYIRTLYVFIGEKSEKNCYWKQVLSEKVNSCPSLPGSDIMEYTDSNDYFQKKHKDTKEIAKYTNNGNPQFTLTCFRTTEDTNEFYSVVTDKNGNHVITVKDIDCTSKDNIEGSFYVDTIYDDMDLDHLAISSRFTLDEDWCTYYYHKTKVDSTRGYFIRKWIYYDYEPKQNALKWNKVSGEATSESQKSKGRTRARNQVGNPKVSLMTTIDSPKEECLPQYKEPKDLGFTVNL